MHGHPFDGPTQLWWGTGRPHQGVRNLFRGVGETPPAGDMFRAGGLIDANGFIGARRTEIHNLMTLLAKRMQAGTPPGDNPKIPSGYTYLLQFIAHDMVDSAVAFKVNGGAVTLLPQNARLGGLLLDTLYGAGPEECVQAYQFKDPRHSTPRTRLRVGKPSDYRPELGAISGDYCPQRDVARGMVCSKDEGFVDQPALRKKLKEALIADSRNDSHALISQLTVLFQLLHNRIVSIVERATAQDRDGLPKRELALRRFQCARLVVTAIYHNIIKKDVLRRILDEGIYGRFMSNPQLPDRGPGAPLEFTFGAFRFGHAMVRNEYNVNNLHPSERMSAGLDFISKKMTENWLVDWARFFDIQQIDQENLNFSKLIGPMFSPAIANTIEFDAKLLGEGHGLAFRDLISGCFAGLLSVPVLCKELRDSGFAEIEDFAVWRQRMRDWLIEKHPFNESAHQASLELILNDPPLSFFVLFEAGYREGGLLGGQNLGPLGSTIMAASVFGALEPHSLGLTGASWKEQMRSAGDLLFKPAMGVGAALETIEEIASMPALLKYMQREGLLAAG